MPARFLALLFFVLSSVLPVSATAQDGGQRYAERTELDFEEVELTATLERPTVRVVLQERRAEFNPLITLRTDFDVEMRRSVAEVK